MASALTVRDLMSTDLVTLAEDDTLNHAQRCMARGRIRHLPVVQGDQLVGLITHRDLLAASFSIFADVRSNEQRRVFSTVPVVELMHRNVMTLRPEQSVAEAAAMLMKNKYGCLPVTDEEGKLLGIVTEADFLQLTVRLLG